MSKHTVKGFVHYSKEDWNEAASYEIYPFHMTSMESRVLVCEQTFEVEIPDDFNPIPQQVAALEEQKRQERLRLAQRLAVLDEKISKLTCIEHTAEAA